MTTHQRLVQALSAFVDEHGSADAIVEMVSLTCYSVVAWHGLLEDDETRARAMETANAMSGVVEGLDQHCFERRMRQCN